MKIELDRREFLKGCCATATVGAVGPALFFGNAAHAAVMIDMAVRASGVKRDFK